MSRAIGWFALLSFVAGCGAHVRHRVFVGGREQGSCADVCSLLQRRGLWRVDRRALPHRARQYEVLRAGLRDLGNVCIQRRVLPRWYWNYRLLPHQSDLPGLQSATGHHQQHRRRNHHRWLDSRVDGDRGRNDRKSCDQLQHGNDGCGNVVKFQFVEFQFVEFQLVEFQFVEFQFGFRLHADTWGQLWRQFHDDLLHPVPLQRWNQSGLLDPKLGPT
jgi:hypothetical protein